MWNDKRQYVNDTDVLLLNHLHLELAYSMYERLAARSQPGMALANLVLYFFLPPLPRHQLLHPLLILALFAFSSNSVSKGMLAARVLQSLLFTRGSFLLRLHLLSSAGFRHTRCPRDLQTHGRFSCFWTLTQALPSSKDVIPGSFSAWKALYHLSDLCSSIMASNENCSDSPGPTSILRHTRKELFSFMDYFGNLYLFQFLNHS